MNTATAPAAPTRTALSAQLLALVDAYDGHRDPITIEARALRLEPADVDAMARALGFVLVERGPRILRYVPRSEWEARTRAEAPRPAVKPAPARPAAPSPGDYWRRESACASHRTAAPAPKARPSEPTPPAQASQPASPSTRTEPVRRNMTDEIYRRRAEDVRQWTSDRNVREEPRAEHAKRPRSLAEIAAHVYGSRALGVANRA